MSDAMRNFLQDDLAHDDWLDAVLNDSQDDDKQEDKQNTVNQLDDTSTAYLDAGQELI